MNTMEERGVETVLAGTTHSMEMSRTSDTDNTTLLVEGGVLRDGALPVVIHRNERHDPEVRVGRRK